MRRLMVASLRYLDTFVKVDDTWLFAERLLFVDWQDERGRYAHDRYRIADSRPERIIKAPGVMAKRRIGERAMGSGNAATRHSPTRRFAITGFV